MNKTAFRILLAITGLAAVAPLGWAQGRDREPVTITSGTILANRCGFPIDVRVVSNNEYQDVATLADGTTITRIRGNLVLSFTNNVTGFTITRQVSGPTTETDHFDGSGTFIGGTFVGEGENYFIFGPVSQGNTGEPGLVFTKGLVVLALGSTGVSSFSLKGTQINGCELLAPST